MRIELMHSSSMPTDTHVIPGQQKDMSTSSERPNIIYILGDDHRADYLGVAGHPILKTPELDRLAAEGTYFPEAFCTSPLCTPSRASHYLGQWERKHAINFNSGQAVSPTAWAKSFPQLLKEAGYFTGWVGKNHVPVGEGGYASPFFAESFDYWYGNHNHTGFYPKDGHDGMYDNAAADTQPEVFLEGALNFLRHDADFSRRSKHPLPERPVDQPFCLCLTYNLPHDSSTSTMQLRPSDDELYKSAYRDQINDMPRPATWAGFNAPPKIPRHVWNGIWIPSYDYVKTAARLKEHQVRICQTVSGVDRALGRLRQELADLGLADNTIIVFSTDHGIHHGEHGIGGKVLMYEEDLRIPMIVLDPRIPAAARGQVRDELVVVEDLAPTVLELCGLNADPGMQGNSLVPLLRGQKPVWRQEFFAENLFDAQNYPRCEAIRSCDWKYIRYFARTEEAEDSGLLLRGTLDDYNEKRHQSLGVESPIYEELYHLADDPHEQQNLIDDPMHQEVLKHFRQRINELGQVALGQAQYPNTVPAQRGTWVNVMTQASNAQRFQSESKRPS